jgi:hypothetical protein
VTPNPYIVPARELRVPDAVVRDVALLLEPGRRQYAARVARMPELRKWLAALDACAPHRPEAVVPATVWISTTEAAEMLGVSDRQVRNIADRLRHERRGRVLVFDLVDIEEERDARLAS